MSLMARRAGLAGQAGDGKIWLFDNGKIGKAAGGFGAHGPNGGNDMTVTIGKAINFTLSYSNRATIKTMVTEKTVNAEGKNLHVKVLTHCTDGRARNCWVYVYASQTVTDTTDIPSTNSGIAQYFPGGNGKTFYIPYNSAKEMETEIVVPITQNNTFISVGVLKQYIFVEYAKITQMWIE